LVEVGVTSICKHDKEDVAVAVAVAVIYICKEEVVET
jgi:hypothetical protein